MDSFSKGIWINRKRTYMAGLSSDRFPGSGREDAILLDAERTAISPDLSWEGPQQREVYSMAELLAVAAGPVVLSFPCFNTVENKELFPASILLQAFRLYAGDPRKDYSRSGSFCRNIPGVCPLQVIKHFWMKMSGGSVAKRLGLRTLLAPVLRAFQPGPWRGCMEERALPDFSFFDGRYRRKGICLTPGDQSRNGPVTFRPGDSGQVSFFIFPAACFACQTPGRNNL